MPPSDIFERTFRNYLDQVFLIDLNTIKDKLGFEMDGNDCIISFFGHPYRISSQGINDSHGVRSSYLISVILCRYLIMCPEVEPKENDWVTYKDFKDAVPFVGGFLENCEKPISRNFSGHLSELKQICKKMGGRAPQMDLSSDLAMQFEALPRIPILMLFNDKDEDFPAKCSILFERRAHRYLDMECLAMIGMAFSDILKKSDEESSVTTDDS